jgi:hypothetical protein
VTSSAARIPNTFPASTTPTTRTATAYGSPNESRASTSSTGIDILDGYRQACAHADATIEELPIDAPGVVPWWPQPDVKLFNVMVHVLTETNRHAGHADILREQLDEAAGADPVTSSEEDWAAHRLQIETAARVAARLV